jgi:hypothetical protein
MVVYTGGSASVVYGYEGASTYGTAASSLTNIFGLEQKVTSFSLSNTRINLAKLGQVEPTKFAYGQQTGSLSVGFVFDDGDSHKVFESLYGTPSGTLGTSVDPFLYPVTLAQGGVSPTIKSLTTQVSLQTGVSTKLVRTLKGCVVNSLGLSTSIGEPLRGSVDMTFGKEDNATVSTSGEITQQDDGTFDQGTTPYTFAHGDLKVSNGTTPQSVAEIQDVDITFAQNSELLYALNQNSAVDAYRRVFDITGRFKTAWKDASLIQYVINQVRSGQELLDTTSGVGVELVFTNGTKSIKLELDDLSIADHNVTGIEPVEPVFEEVNWQIKSSRITVVNA